MTVWLTLMTIVHALTGAAGDETDLAAHMERHFSQVTLIQGALIEADLERARELAGWMADHAAPAGMPAGWQTHVEEIKAQATTIRDATELTAAADAAAEMASACGACHQRHGVSTWLNSTAPEPLGDGMTERMGRHRWAADRLWEGLIGPMEQSWQQGAEALAEAPLESERLLGEPQLRAELLANQVYRLGARARQVSDPDSRARLYGSLLSICAECHRLYRARD